MRGVDDLAHLQVGGRKAQRTTALIAMLNDSVGDPVALERPAGGGHVAALDHVADAG